MVNERILNMRMPGELYAKIKEYAESKNISIASVVRIACSELLEKENSKK